MKRLVRYWQNISRIGAKEDSSYLDLKRVYMVNITAMICVLPAFIFTLINFVEGRWLLSGINFLNSLCFGTVILLQFYSKHRQAKVVLLVSSFCLFFVGGLLYRNGGEYFLLALLVVTMLLYDDLKILVTGGVVTIFAILIIHAAPASLVLESVVVPKERALFNITSSLFFTITAIGFFKRVIYHDKQQIEEQRLKLEEMNAEKEKVFSIIAHDMRAPLVNAGNIIDILQANTLDGPALEQVLGQLRQQIKEQNKVLESILQWSSTKMRGAECRRTPVSVSELITDIVQSFRMQYTRKKLFFNITIDGNLQVLAVRDHLIIIFRNLISNSIKFSHPGGEIKIYVSECLERVRVHIEDQGVGILSSQSDMLFDRVQNRSLGTANEPGSGLGLVLCKELIELNNGDINVDSRPQKGSIFTVGFPNVKNNIKRQVVRA